MNFDKTIKYIYYRCVRLHGRPREVSMGMAIGLAIGMTPTMGIQMPIAIAIAAFMGQSKISAALGVWISNPLTAFPLYMSTYTVGAWLLGYPLNPPDGFFHALTSIKGLTGEILVPLFVGGLFLAIPVAVTGYWLTYQAVIAYRLKVRHKRARKLHKWKWNPHDGWHRTSVKHHDGKPVHDHHDES